MASERFEMRVPVELLARIDEARGFERRASWIKRTLESALSDAEGPSRREQAAPGPVGSPEPVRAAAPSRAPGEVVEVELWPPEPSSGCAECGGDLQPVAGESYRMCAECRALAS